MKKGTRLSQAVVLALVASGALAMGEDLANVVSDRWFKGGDGRETAGCFHIVRKKSDQQLAPVLLICEFAAVARGKPVSFKMEMLCKDDAWLTPVKLTASGQGDDEFQTFVATIDWLKTDTGLTGTLRTTRRGRETTMAIPEHTAEFFALFDIVCGRPFEKDKVLNLHVLEGTELNLKKDHTLSWVGEEEIHVGDQVVKAHRFELAQANRRPVQYWVNEKRELVRVLIDERKEFLLTTEADAKKVLEAPK